MLELVGVDDLWGTKMSSKSSSAIFFCLCFLLTGDRAFLGFLMSSITTLFSFLKVSEEGRGKFVIWGLAVEDGGEKSNFNDKEGGEDKETDDLGCRFREEGLRDDSCFLVRLFLVRFVVVEGGGGMEETKRDRQPQVRLPNKGFHTPFISLSLK